MSGRREEQVRSGCKEEGGAERTGRERRQRAQREHNGMIRGKSGKTVSQPQAQVEKPWHNQRHEWENRWKNKAKHRHK